MATRFGAYEILHELSTGGMGSVLLGRRRGPGAFEQLVAIKTIRSEYAGAEAVRAMFLDEAAILARLSHPAIATVHDFGEDAGTLYMVMEYVAGVSLRGMVGQLPPGVAARAIAEACRGLHAAHELRDLAGQPLGLVHRDISPDNIMLGFDGHVKVIDFGIALVKNRQAPVTELGMLKGKPPYMSPEQIKNEALDRRSDVFSLGVVLHELVTGEPLFSGDSIYAVARAVEMQEIRPPSHVLGRALPAGLDAAVMNALARDPARRTPTAAALAEQLEHVIQIAGDETLEAWSERELAQPRDAHRRWIASVVGGADNPRVIGRPTGLVTALGADAPGPDVPAAAANVPVAEQPPGRETPTHLPRITDDELVAPRRSPLVPLVVALVLLAALGGGIALVMSSRTSEAPPDARIAIDADASTEPALDTPVAIDATLVDAAVAVDARPPVRPPIDARPPVRPPPVPRDAATTVPIDAAPPAGFGTLTITHKGRDSFLNVVVDGKLLGATPKFKMRIAAGEHVVELVEPDTGNVVVRRTITVAVGGHVTVEP